MNDFTGEIAAIGTSLCFAIGSVLFTFAGRELGALLVNRSRLLLATVMIALLHLLLFRTLLPIGATTETISWLALSGFVGLVLGDICLMQAFVAIGPRLSMLMMALAPMFSTVIAWVFLNETLAPQEVIGIVLVVVGVIAVVTERHSTGSTSVVATGPAYRIGLLLALGGSLGQAGGTILSRLGLTDGLEPLSASLIRLAVASLILWAYALLRNQVPVTIATLRARPHAVRLMTIATIAGPVIGVWLSLIAVQRTSVGVASTLTSLTPIFLIPISFVVFKERIAAQAIIGTMIAFVGTILLFV